MPDGRDFCFLENLHAAVTGAAGQRLGDIHRVAVTVAGNVDAAKNVAVIDQRVPFLDLRLADNIHLQLEHPGHRSAALEFLEALFVGGD